MEHEEVNICKNALAETPKSVVIPSSGTQTALKEDLLLGRLVLIQGNNALKRSGNVKDGDVLNTLSNEIVADGKKAIELIPLFSIPVWDWCYTDGKKERVKTMARLNSDPGEWRRKDYAETFMGRKMHPLKGVVLTALIKGDVLPVIVKFQKSSYWSAARQLETLKTMLDMNKKKMFEKSVMLSSAEQAWEGNQFQVYKITWGKDTTADEKQIAENLVNYFSGKDIEVDGDE